MATFSSKQYQWKNITIAFGGRIVEGVTEVEYTEKTEKSYLYGRGNQPHEIMEGNRTYEGKLTIWQSELEAMTRDSADGDLLNIRFDVVVAYIPSDAGQVVTDIIKDVEFTEVKKGLKQGDKNMMVEMPIMFLRVKRQA